MSENKKEEMLQFETDDNKENKNQKSLIMQNKILKIVCGILIVFVILLIYKLCPKTNTGDKKGSEILVLKESDISKIIQMSDIIAADREALSIYSNGLSNIPLRTNINVPEYKGQCLFMNGYAGPAKALGVKIVSVYPENINKNLTSVPATMVLVDAETGIVNALIDGTYLTRLRTGAISGLATDLLAPKNCKIFALFGTGGQAITQLEAVLTVRKIELVKVFDIYYDRAVEFAKRMNELFSKKYNNVKIIAVTNSDEAVADADIITSVTTSKKPVFNAAKVKKNAHINGVGSYTPEMCEIPEEILVKANKIYVDTRDGAIKESGDLINPLKKGLISMEKINGELGELINGKIKGRESDDEMTFFKTTGSAVLDLVAAQKIYELAKKKNIGKIIDL